MRQCSYLCLGEPEGGGELGALRQREVLRALEALVELLQLQGAVDGPRLAHLLPLAAVHSQLLLHPGLIYTVRNTPNTRSRVGEEKREKHELGVIHTWVWDSPSEAANSARSGRDMYCVCWKRSFSRCSWKLEYMVFGLRIFLPRWSYLGVWLSWEVGELPGKPPGLAAVPVWNIESKVEENEKGGGVSVSEFSPAFSSCSFCKPTFLLWAFQM